jgi:hypothetical protein
LRPGTLGDAEAGDHLVLADVEPGTAGMENLYPAPPLPCRAWKGERISGRYDVAVGAGCRWWLALLLAGAMLAYHDRRRAQAS